MIFEDPFTGMPVVAAGITLENVFLNLVNSTILVDEPVIHDSPIAEECSLCGPLLREAIIADLGDEIDRWETDGGS